MERTEVLDMMGTLKLYGMKAAYDETLATALKRKHEPQRFVGDLLRAEISEKQARSIKYQLTIARLPLAKDVEDFAFKDTPINEALARDLAGGAFIAQQRNVVLVGGTGTGKTHLAIAIARSCIRSGARGRFFTTVDLVNRLEAEARAGRQGRIAGCPGLAAIGARLDDELLRRFIEAYEGALGIVRPLIDFQHVFHIGDEGRASLGRDHPLLLAMGLENVFLSVRPIVLSLALSTICDSTSFSSRRRRVHLARPAGAGPQARAISLASAAPSKIRRGADLGLDLRVRTASKPSSTRRRRVRSIVGMLVSSASAVRLSLHPSPASYTSAFNRMRAIVNKCPARLPLRINSSSRARSSPLSLTTYFFTAASLPATNHLHRPIAMPLIQTRPSNAMT